MPHPKHPQRIDSFVRHVAEASAKDAPLGSERVADVEQPPAPEAALGATGRTLLEAASPRAHFGRGGGKEERFSQASGSGETQPSETESGSTAKPRKAIRTLHSSVNVGVEDGRIGVESDVLKALEKATLQDVRWDNALQHIRKTEAWDHTVVRQLMRRGAKSFGFWHLSDAVLDSLAAHVLGEPVQESRALQAWMSQEDCSLQQSKASKRLASLHDLRAGGTMKKDAPAKRKGSGSRIHKAILTVIALIASNLYALDVVLWKYPGIMKLFSWKIYVARAAGMGTLVWTAFLFLTMSRTLHRALLARLHVGNPLLNVANAHKELHIFCGKMLLGTAALHVLAHLAGTVPGIVRHTAAELNELLGCANPDTTRGFLDVNFHWLVWPHCPLQREFTYWEVIFMSTVGISGLLLMAIICTVGYTSRKTARATHFDRFWYIHNTALFFWPLVLFVHGSNSWVGIGCPLVLFVVAPPILCYAADRLLRLLRYYLFAGRAVAIKEAVIRPGRNGEANGALTYLMITKPPFLWCSKFKAGMYAFLCMPDYAPAQWHPFSISSGPEDDTLQFIIQGVGDWTEELARKCLEMYKPQAEGVQLEFPRIAVDGPYLAPTVSALSKEVLVAVGAGVGVTPFLSLLSAIITGLTGEGENIPLKEAHFYWMTRNADELLFGRRLFTRIVSEPRLRNKVFLHLHVTHRAPDGDVGAFLFREAVKRQSQLDKRSFEAAKKQLAKKELADLAAVAPWNWLHGAKEDLLWVASLVETADGSASAEITAAHSGHWSGGTSRASSSSIPSSISEDVAPKHCNWARRFRMRARSGQGRSTRGLFTEGPAADTSSTFSFSKAVAVGPKGFGAFLPVAFGRPDFLKEVRAVGTANPDEDIQVYVCGNTALVKSLKQVCVQCTDHAASSACDGQAPQRYTCHFERFG